MKYILIVPFFLVVFIPFDSNAKSKTITAVPLSVNQVKEGIQYIKKGSQWQDLPNAPYVVEVGMESDYFKFSQPNWAHSDSMYILFKPGDLLSVRFSSVVIFDNVQGYYTFNYVLFSERASEISIRGIDIPKLNDYAELKSPPSWDFRTRFVDKIYSCYSNSNNYNLLPGDSLLGFSIKSYGPPVLETFSVIGNAESQRYGVPEYEERFGDEFARMMYDHRGVDVLTVMPGPVPERIDPGLWFGKIFYSLNDLHKWGYINDHAMKDINQIIKQLFEPFLHESSLYIEQLELLVQSSLSELTNYQNQMEPEAWAYIAENLKFVLRNLDIVKFKYYP